MTIRRSTAPLACAVVLMLPGACSKPATQTTATSAAALTPVAAGTAPAALPATPAGYASTPAAGDSATASTPASTPANGYSCSFPGPGGRAILARFTLDATGARDDQGLPFTVLANSPTALVLAHPRDDLAAAPNGDVGAYVVAIDRRSLGMVETTVGLNGQGSSRRGHCIVG